MTEAWRATLMMCVLYSGIGLSLPFLPVWLREVRDLDGWEIGAILSGAQLARLFTGAGLAAWGEGRTVRRAVRAFMAVTLASWLVFAAVNDLTVMIVAGFIGSSVAMSAGPFVEMAALRATRAGSLSFGVSRSLGSGAFMLTNIAAGWAIAKFGPEIVMPWMLVNSCLALVAANYLPRGVQPPRNSLASRLSGMSRLVRNRTFLRIALAASFVQASHAFYYAFSTNVWRMQGFSETTIGLLWAFAVVVEIFFLTNSGAIVRIFGVERVLMLGAVIGIVRWTALASQPDLPMVVALQVLHTGTFAMTYIATLRLIERDVPEESQATALSLAAALGGGTLLGVATLASGVLFDAVGAKGYYAMSVMAFMGLLFWFLLATPRSRVPQTPSASA